MASPFKYGLTPSATPSWSSGGTSHVLDEERKKATFDVEKLTNFLDGGADMTKKRRWIVSQTQGHDFPEKPEASRADMLQKHLDTFIEVHKEFAEKGYVPTRREVAWMSANSANKGALMNSYGLFLPTILANASAEQTMWWLPKVYTFQIVGAYAQTELGHGSNVRGLQTTATYDKAKQQFVLNTPTLTSMKWWPGALGKVATHATVYAQLIIDNRQYGLHVFMLQLRDEKHMPLPGIELGDLGSKMGDGANDTSYMRLKDVRIPREHMLCKGAVVMPDGRYLRLRAKKENPVMHYATMLGARAGMMSSAGGILAAGCTILTRYSVIRRQGFVNTDTSDFQAAENKIIDYSVQRYRIFKEVALAYAITLTGSWLSDKAEILTRGGDTKELMAVLPEVHASAAGLKAIATYDVHLALESLRKGAGGNGYLLNSGISMMTLDYAWQVTAEGDVIVLLLSLAKYLMKMLEQAKRGEPLAGLVASLAPLKDPSFKVESLAPRRAKSAEDFKNPAFLEELFKYRAINAIVNAGEELESNRKRGMAHDAAWNATALNLVQTAKSFCYYFMLAQMNEQVAKGAQQDAKVGVVLKRLSAMYGCSQILDGQQWLGIVSAAEAKLLQQAVNELMEELRPDALALSEAFEIPDRVLNSTIGRKDGNIYEALFQAAKESPLNKTEVFPGYEKVLKPHLDLDFLQNKNLEPLGEIYVDEDGSEAVNGEAIQPGAKL